MPEFVMFIAEDQEMLAKLADEDFAANFEKVSAWFEKHTRAGSVVAGGGRRIERSNATTVRVDGGQAIVTDGPFAETKELIGGYALLDVAHMDAAVELAKSWPGLPLALELRPVIAG